MAFKRFISVALAGLMVVSSINTGSIRAYASSNESELFTAEDIIETGEESEGAELMEEVAQTEQDVAVSEEDGGLADEDVVDDDIIGSDESADEAETVEVTLDANGGLFGGEEEILVINVKAGGSLSDLIDAPAKEGAEFEGWYLDEALTEEVDLNSYVFTENSVLYASWQEITTEGEEEDEDGMSELLGTYFFTLDANGGKFPNGNEIIDVASEITYLTDNKYMPELEGKEFKGWYKEKECTTLLSQSDSGSSRYYLKNEPEDGQTLYAGWSKTYTLTYVFGTMTGTDPVKNTGYYWDYSKKEHIKSMEIQIPEGESSSNYAPSSYSSYARNEDFHYEFDGYWYKDENRTEKVNLYNENPTGNTTYYAGYRNEYYGEEYKVVTFKSSDDNGYFTQSSGNYEETDGQYDEIAYRTSSYVYTSSIERYAKNSDPRKVVEGYYTDKACTEKATDEYNKITVDSDKTIYIKWTDSDKKVVTFDANGGYFSKYKQKDGTPATEVKFSGEYDEWGTYCEFGKVLNSDPHMYLKGWSTDPDATTPEKTGSTYIYYDFSDDTTYYAIWEDAYKLVTFDANGGTFSYYDSDSGKTITDVSEAIIKPAIMAI